MLKIHKPYFKLLIIPIVSICGIGAFLKLVYHPNLAHAETVVYPGPETRTMADITYMQDITPEICQNSVLNQQYTLTDSRDEKTYTVARIKNQTNDESNCWMTQNLAIINRTINSTDSDIVSGNFIIPISSINNFTESNEDSPKAYNHSTYGGYYNWFTATAGSGTSDFVGGDTPDSICPKGWKLPTGGESGEFYSLLNGLSVVQINAAPYNYVYGGNVNNSSLSSAGSAGQYWSSTAGDVISVAYYLFFSTGGVLLSNRNSRYLGMPVRCLTRTESIPNNNVEINVNSTISLDVASEITIEKGDTNPSIASLPVLVTSNQPYTISVSSASPNLTSATNSTTIPSKPGLLNTAEDAWGMKLSSDTNYTQISSTPTTLYTATVAEAKTTSLQIGVSASPDLPNGEYSTNITVTATQS